MKRRRDDKKITAFFSRIEKNRINDVLEQEILECLPSTSAVPEERIETQQNRAHSTSKALENVPSTSSIQQEEANDPETPKWVSQSSTLMDIAAFIDNVVESDWDKLALIKQKIPSLESLPVIKQSGHTRRFQPSWCSKYPWLKYSRSEDGGYCVACVLFGGTSGGGQLLGILVNKPMQKYKKATEVLSSHNSNKYHITAMAKMVAFTNTMENPEKAVDVMLQTQKQAIIENNKQLLVSIIESILFCGRNILPLRGHRDSGTLKLEGESQSGEGVFRALLRFRAQVDDKLKRTITTSPKNSSLLSPTVQNELIDIAGQ